MKRVLRIKQVGSPLCSNGFSITNSVQERNINERQERTSGLAASLIPLLQCSLSFYLFTFFFFLLLFTCFNAMKLKKKKGVWMSSKAITKKKNGAARHSRSNRRINFESYLSKVVATTILACFLLSFVRLINFVDLRRCSFCTVSSHRHPSSHLCSRASSNPFDAHPR